MLKDLSMRAELFTRPVNGVKHLGVSVVVVLLNVQTVNLCDTAVAILMS